jgi:UDPglucose--hexose-1-phosphate uridylyltransferase
MNKKTKSYSEFRYDVASKDWVLIASERGKRPGAFKVKKRKIIKTPKSKCPFCQIETQKKPVLIFSNNKEIPLLTNIPKKWTTIVIPNKYPAVSPFKKLKEYSEGKLYKKVSATGFHELVITRDHDKQIPQFNVNEIKELIDVYQSRYLSLKKEKFVNHISIFHNHGVEAGASISHPHSQIITTPLIDSDLNKALETSKKYFNKNKKCLYCEMAKLERKKKKRIVFENKHFLVLCPFASKSAFQMIISPKKHLSYFENITEKEKIALAQAFKIAFSKFYKVLSDPAYNFYLHTAPCDGRKHSYYHWHWTILPKTATMAGFEIGTRMEISSIEPEKSAQILRKA